MQLLSPILQMTKLGQTRTKLEDLNSGLLMSGSAFYPLLPLLKQRELLREPNGR